MDIKSPELFSKYRSPLMGFAILWVFFFHSSIHIPFLQGLVSIGWGGVDIFLFLSAIGLCYSIRNCGCILTFYKRRLLRIMPIFWLLITIFFVLAVVGNGLHPRSFVEGLFYYSGIGWWISGLYEEPRFVSYEWYTPTILFFYLIFPILNKSSIKTLFCILFFALCLSYYCSENRILYSLHLTYQRIPIFILGIIYFRYIVHYPFMSNERIYVTTFVEILLFVIGFFLLFLCKTKILDGIFQSSFPMRLSMLMIIPTLLKILCLVFVRLNLLKVMFFYGTISYELYLIHIYCEKDTFHPLYFIEEYNLNDNIKVLLILIISTILSFFINKTVAFLLSKSI